MRRFWIVLLAACLVIPFAPRVEAAEDGITESGSTYATVSDDSIVLGNESIERRWDRSAFGTSAFIDKRVSDGVSVAPGPDFSLQIGPTSVPSTLFTATSAEATPLPSGMRLEIQLESPAMNATRIIEIYEGIAGLRERTILEPLGPLAYGGADLSQAAVGPDASATIHAFRAGADWRDPNWTGAPAAIGDKHAGTWRESTSGAPGEAVSGNAEWISAKADDHSLFMVMERNDLPSSRASYDGTSAALTVDLSRDIISGGPFEEQIHAENPTPSPGRHRVLVPGQPFELEPSFVGFGNGEGDEPWQFYEFLTKHRLTPYDRDITFNSNGTDHGAISTGAKDDLDFSVIQEIAPTARRLGVETFILDDGWQAISGDWYPDCPGHPDPRGLYPERFPDCDFTAVREEIAPMKLGLWMSPMHFNPASENFKAHPEWACAPVGHGLAVYNTLEPNSSSNEAGLGTWGPDAIEPVVEPAIRKAIEEWNVEYFKFDFLVWLDCAGQGDMYDYHDAFMGMVDRLQADYPDVTFQIDETNDYRLFPFESISRGPAWFQNGSPSYSNLLHNLWNMSPYIPTSYVGQHFLGNRNEFGTVPIGTLMAAAMPSHMTFFSDLRSQFTPPALVDQAAPWTAFYKEHRDLLGGMAYPLLDDPIEGGWTALQPWDPEEARGSLLAFRQGADDATKTIALRNVPAGMTFDLIEAPSGNKVGTATSEELTTGLDITLPEKHSAKVLLIVPAQAEEFDPSTTLTYDGDLTARAGSTAVLAATLRGSDGPIAGAPITFTFRGEEVSAVTDAAGRATARVRVSGPPGVYEVTATYPGTGRLESSGTTALLEIRSRS
jgi:hypothetical protein